MVQIGGTAGSQLGVGSYKISKKRTKKSKN